jgi:hypothetical protein
VHQRLRFLVVILHVLVGFTMLRATEFFGALQKVSTTSMVGIAIGWASLACVSVYVIVTTT